VVFDLVCGRKRPKLYKATVCCANRLNGHVSCLAVLACRCRSPPSSWPAALRRRPVTCGRGGRKGGGVLVAARRSSRRSPDGWCSGMVSDRSAHPKRGSMMRVPASRKRYAGARRISLASGHRGRAALAEAPNAPGCDAGTNRGTPLPRGRARSVRLAPWMAAIRATPRTPPLAAVPSRMRARVAGSMRTRPAATATRAVSALAPTSTMWARPWESKWVRSLTGNR
jgi:hypothetical protein